MLRDIKFKPVSLFVLSLVLSALSCLYPGCEGLIFISVLPLFLSFGDSPLKQRLITGFAAGFCLSFFLVYWLSQLTLTGVLFFCLWNASGFGLIALLWQRAPGGLTLPLIYAIYEGTRDYLLPGSSFGSIGLILSDYPLLIQIASIGGLPGVSFWIMGVNFSAYKCWISDNQGKRFIPCLGLLLWITVPLIYGAFRLEEGAFLQKKIITLRIGLIQPNIVPEEKWNVSREKEIFSVLERLSLELKPFHPDVLLWPETAIPVSWHFNAEAKELVKRVGENLKCPILFGSIDSRAENHYNAVFYADQKQTISSIYHKMNLVPFGEYIPMAEVFPFLKNVIPLPYPFNKGEQSVSFVLNGVKILPLICFEDTLSHFVRKTVHLEKPDLLVVFTNDGWFKGLGGALNHDRLARFRAVENGIPMVRCTNTGVSSVLDAKGRVLDGISVKGRIEGVEGVKAVELKISPSIKTFFSMGGDLGLALCFICSICFKVFFWNGKTGR